ncbi:hypothetical protein ACRTEC_08015 [Janibacter indicus]
MRRFGQPPELTCTSCTKVIAKAAAHYVFERGRRILCTSCVGKHAWTPGVKRVNRREAAYWLRLWPKPDREIRYTPDGAPLAPVVRYYPPESALNGAVVDVWCPLCFHQHQHGAGVGIEGGRPTLGDRASHCLDSTLGGGYVVDDPAGLVPEWVGERPTLAAVPR